MNEQEKIDEMASLTETITQNLARFQQRIAEIQGIASPKEALPADFQRETICAMFRWLTLYYGGYSQAYDQFGRWTAADAMDQIFGPYKEQ